MRLEFEHNGKTVRALLDLDTHGNFTGHIRFTVSWQPGGAHYLESVFHVKHTPEVLRHMKYPASVEVLRSLEYGRLPEHRFMPLLRYLFANEWELNTFPIQRTDSPFTKATDTGEVRAWVPTIETFLPAELRFTDGVVEGCAYSYANGLICKHAPLWLHQNFARAEYLLYRKPVLSQRDMEALLWDLGYSDCCDVYRGNIFTESPTQRLIDLAHHLGYRIFETD